MRQGIVTLTFGMLGTAIAQWLSDISRAADDGTFMEWLTNFSNGDVLAVIQILLICYVYSCVQEVKKALPQETKSSSGMLRIFGF